MNRHCRNIFLATALVAASVSCVKEKLEVTYNNQESKIDQYINTNKYFTDGEVKDSLRVVHNGGSNRLVRAEGAGDELDAQGTVAFYYAGYIFSGNKNSSNLFTTNHKETAESAGWTLTDEDFAIYRINMSETELVDGLRKGLLGVRSGEHCEIIFSGKYGFGRKELGIIPANSALLYEIWVEAVSND